MASRGARLAAVGSIGALSFLLNPFFIGAVVGLAALVALPKRPSS